MLKALPIALVFGCQASLALAECPEGARPIFSCEIPEHNAYLELCSDKESRAHYSYYADGMQELAFTPETSYFSLRRVTGLSEQSSGIGLSNKGTIYALYLDEQLYFDSADRSAPSLTPAVLQVYASEKAFEDRTKDAWIARRVCQPDTINVAEDFTIGP